MKLPSRLEKRLFFGLILGTMLFGSLGVRYREKIIFEEVKSYLAENYDGFKDKDLSRVRSKIKFVSRDELGEIFKKFNSKIFAKWEKEYGKKQADYWRDLYQKEVIGLFVPKYGNIYVGNFLDPCRERGIIGHEITHRLQEFFGIGDEFGLENKDTYREMQAGRVEKMLMESCK